MADEKGPQVIPLTPEDYLILNGAIERKFGVPIEEIAGRRAKLDALMEGFRELVLSQIDNVTKPDAPQLDNSSEAFDDSGEFDDIGDRFAISLVKSMRERMEQEGRPIEVVVKPENNDVKKSKNSGISELVAKIHF